MASPQPLSSHAHRIRIGEPLPFGICDGEGRLLLAMGQTLHSQGQLDGLLDRGAFVFRDMAAEAAAEIAAAKPHQLPSHWDRTGQQLSGVLRGPMDAQFEGALERVSKPLVALVKRDPDLAILQIVRPEEGPVGNYSNRRALHSAIASMLAGQRLGWGDDAGKSLFRAALTMNIGMSELQNRLATQVTPLTALQKQAIVEHPHRSAELLEAAGVADAMWINAVACHHEKSDGSGYPLGCTDLAEAAQLLNRVDTFTAKFSPRAHRPAVPADQAVRQFFAADTKSPLTAAIVKEFGLYPPGSTVRLKSGEVGIAMRRGAGPTTPIVAVLATRQGDPLMTPVRRDTAQAEHAVASLVPASMLKVRLPLERLIQACDH